MVRRRQVEKVKNKKERNSKGSHTITRKTTKIYQRRVGLGAGMEVSFNKWKFLLCGRKRFWWLAAQQCKHI